MTKQTNSSSCRKSKPLRALDLFAGAGGLGCGYQWFGGTVAAAVEVDEFASSTFRENHAGTRVWTEDIRSLRPRDLAKEAGPFDMIIGGPMCQGVSQRGPRDPHRDERNFAFWAFTAFLRELRPDYFLMENVPALVSDVHNRQLAIAVFEDLESLGYSLAADVVNAAWFGVPQLRYRCIVLGSRVSQPTFPGHVVDAIMGRISESDFVTVGDAIMDLPEVAAGGGQDLAVWPSAQEWSPYVKQLKGRGRRLYNHWSADTDEINLNRISHVPEGGNWHDIPASLLPRRFSEVRPSDHTTTYRRLHREHPAHTITTECGNVTSGAFTHPTQNRAITVREAARLQGFPDHFRFAGPKGAQYRQVGNAVPPLMAKALFENLVRGGAGFKGRLSAELLRRHRNERLPFTLAPRYRPLFGKSSWAKRRLQELIA